MSFERNTVARVEPIAIVTMKSKAFHFDSVRLPVTRNPQPKDHGDIGQRADNGNTEQVVPAVEKHVCFPGQELVLSSCSSTNIGKWSEPMFGSRFMVTSENAAE